MKSDRDQPFGQHDSHEEHQQIVFLGIVAALLEIIVAAIDTPGLMGLLTSMPPVIVCIAALKQIDALR